MYICLSGNSSFTTDFIRAQLFQLANNNNHNIIEAYTYVDSVPTHTQTERFQRKDTCMLRTYTHTRGKTRTEMWSDVFFMGVEMDVVVIQLYTVNAASGVWFWFMILCK